MCEGNRVRDVSMRQKRNQQGKEDEERKETQILSHMLSHVIVT